MSDKGTPLKRKFNSNAKTSKPEPKTVKRTFDMDPAYLFAAEMAVAYNQRCLNKAQELRTQANITINEGTQKLAKLARRVAKASDYELPDRFQVNIDLDAGTVSVEMNAEDVEDVD